MQDQAKAAGWEKPVPTALLVMADGTVIEGFGFGAPGKAVGEVCFNTAMTGYQEILTDPSYAAQIVTFTFPHIGNVGVNDEDVETVDSDRVSGARGVIVQAPATEPSNFRAQKGLDAWLKARGMIGLYGVDTRALTALIREKGMPNAVIAYAPDGEFDVDALKAEAASWPGIDGMDLVPDVTAKQDYGWTATTWRLGEGFGEQQAPRFKVVALDFGVKRNILRLLAEAGCEVKVVRATASAAEILAEKPDGVFLSNGPGDPEPCTYAVDNIRRLMGRQPIFGICLGHQLTGIALGGKTFKLKFGHHGGNHPVKQLASGKIEITAHNHNFAVDPDSLPQSEVELTHIDLNDSTLEGMRHRNLPLFTVQYHPEAAPGPHDSHYLFKDFVRMMEECKR